MTTSDHVVILAIGAATGLAVDLAMMFLGRVLDRLVIPVLREMFR